MLEAIPADDSGAAATKVDQELLDLRATCSRLDITWHWRHKASSLKKMIDGYVHPDKEPDEPVVTATVTTSGSGNTQTINTSARRTIPQDVRDALEYMYSYKRANAKLVEAFIESLL